jgi:Uridine phosphorylase
MDKIGASELIINSDGSVFHLHIKPEELADTVILVGDPGRVDMVSLFLKKKSLGTNQENLFPLREDIMEKELQSFLLV